MPVLLPNRQPASHLAALGLAVVLSTIPARPLGAAVTLTGDDAFVTSGAPSGDLTVTGDLSIVKGIDFGTAAAHPALSAAQINYFGGSENAAKIDLTDPLGTIQWRDNLVAAARDKMKLDGGNLLTLYKSDGTGVGILLNPNTGQIQLPGTGGGIYAAGIPVFTIGSSGNLVFGNRPLSLGNTSTSYSSGSGALTVAGGMGVAMDSYINGVRVGRGGGNVITNTAYGSYALQCDTLGSGNTATGYFALCCNTTGYCNTASGAYTLYRNTTGSSNTAAGYFSLFGNTTGYGNTAAGYYSLYSNTTGGSNTAAGSYSLYGNTTGYGNTAAGYYSLYGNTTGSSNTAAGYFSLFGNTTGYSNTAAGYFSLYSNSMGSNNTAVGSYSLGRSSSGYSNTACGTYSLGYIASGASNVAIGSYAGCYEANGASLTASNNSVYIGANVRGFSNLEQNAIVIGSGATGEGTNTTVIGTSGTVKTHLYGTVSASRFTATASGGEALVVEGHTRLKGKVIIEQAQGDISMGIYGP